MQKIITEKIGDKVIIVLQGDVDASDARLSRRLTSRQGKHLQYAIWIDCSAIECIKTLGFCHFLNQLLLLKKLNASVTLLDVAERPRSMLHLLHLDSVFTLVPTFEEAYQLVQPY
jgi:anti-anti-sigma factor